MNLEKYLSYTTLNGECMEWTRCFNSTGYPRAGNKQTSNLKVHREVFFLVNGFYPEVVRHSCDNMKCINPDHLIAGTQFDNVKDRNERGRTGNYVSPEHKNEVLTLRKQGMKYMDIANKLDISRRRVEYIVKQLGGM